ncbi:hypothetical protein RUND412_008418 [Rhizina undulata]
MSARDIGYRELGGLLGLEKAAAGGKVVTEVPGAATDVEPTNTPSSSRKQKVRKTAHGLVSTLPSLPSDEVTPSEAEQALSHLEELVEQYLLEGSAEGFQDEATAGRKSRSGVPAVVPKLETEEKERTCTYLKPTKAFSRTQDIRKTAHGPVRGLPSLLSDETAPAVAEHTPGALEELVEQYPRVRPRVHLRERLAGKAVTEVPTAATEVETEEKGQACTFRERSEENPPGLATKAFSSLRTQKAPKTANGLVRTLPSLSSDEVTPTAAEETLSDFEEVVEQYLQVADDPPPGAGKLVAEVTAVATGVQKEDKAGKAWEKKLDGLVERLGIEEATNRDEEME